MYRIGIYDRYLSTAGGGERYSCKMAEILSKQPGYKVDLVTDLFADLKAVSAHLNLDLERVGLKVFPFLSEEYAEKITDDYDIFINATYLSSLSSFAKKNLYLCYFPTPFDVDFKAIHRFLLLFFRYPAIWLYRFADRLLQGYSDMEVCEGIYDIKRFMLGRGSWSSGRAVIIYRSKPDKDPLGNQMDNPSVKNRQNLKRRPIRQIRIGLKNPESSNAAVISCDVVLKKKDSGVVIFNSHYEIKSGFRQHVEISIEQRHEYVGELLLELTSSTFVPAETVAGAGTGAGTVTGTGAGKGGGHRDSRQLGIYVYDERQMNFVRKAILKILGFIPLFLVTFPKDLRFLETYDKVISISEYSRKWIRKFWDKNSTILYPPVDTERFEVKRKEKMIISVGRFFPQHHNKKQYELAQNFIEMYEKNREIMKDFKLVLAGGVEDRPGHAEYVDRIKKISQGYPVEILTNIKWDTLRDLLSRSLIFWHASGMGEDQQRHPEKFEHFGITTVEAMASGCIAVVIDKGGQPEIIDDGKNGFLFDSWDKMKKITTDICSGNIDIARISESAVCRARDFSSENFKQKLLEIIGGTD